MFGFSFKGIYLPYAWLFLEFLFKGGVLPFGGFIGIASAYFYYYLKYEYPSQGGIDYLETPAFFRHTFQRLQNSGNTRRATQNTQNRYGARTPVEGDITNSTNPRRRAGVRLGGS
ncbi:hypothetical protein H4219_001006 [Mycoemilia scoparia]|uniref:Derlin n=1 Tax=Mycoemilia scoparia TaxID=417184 RepID=A0A9W8A747_9FUNG|nr:hypothetical protein H4219_001006 [Mycoemilia scoparia]